MPLRDDERNGRKTRRVIWREKDIKKMQELECLRESDSEYFEESLMELCALKIKTGNAADVLKLLSDAGSGLAILEMKSMAHIESAHYEDALKCAMEAFKTRAGSASASVSLAVCKSMEWDVGAAMDYFEIAESVAPDYGRLYVERGLHYLRTGMNFEASGDFKKAVDLMPGEPEPILELVEAFMSLGASGDAFKLLENTVAEILDSAGIYYLLALLRRNSGKNDAAVAAIKNALNILPDLEEYKIFLDSMN